MRVSKRVQGFAIGTIALFSLLSILFQLQPDAPPAPFLAQEVGFGYSSSVPSSVSSSLVPETSSSISSSISSSVPSSVSSSVASPYCGDGILQSGEQCEPPGSTLADGNACNAGCRSIRGGIGGPRVVPPPRSASASTAHSVSAASSASVAGGAVGGPLAPSPFVFSIWCCDAEHDDWYELRLFEALQCGGGITFEEPEPNYGTGEDVCKPAKVMSCEDCSACGRKSILGACFASNCQGDCRFEPGGLLGVTGACRPDPEKCAWCCKNGSMQRRNIESCLAAGSELYLTDGDRPPPFDCSAR